VTWLWIWLERSWTNNRALTAVVVFSSACLLFSSIGLSADHRLINGEHGWIKPCKFSLSLTIYGLTLIWFSPFITGHKKFFKMISVAALVGTMIELPTIILQVLRGTTSHFNTATSFDQAMFAITVVAITPVAFGVLALFVMLLREKNLPPVIGLALRWGVFLTAIGLIPGVLMVLPDHLQNVLTASKQFEGHTIGFPEGGPGLPILGWSTMAGDLRVAHFVGIHALQVLPIVGYSIAVFLPHLSRLRQELLIWNAGATYLGCTSLLMWQALCAESVTAPSEQTILYYSIMLAGSAMWATGIIMLPPPIKTSTLFMVTEVEQPVLSLADEYVSSRSI
jgi:hypothetical protein